MDQINQDPFGDMLASSRLAHHKLARIGLLSTNGFTAALTMCPLRQLQAYADKWGNGKSAAMTNEQRGLLGEVHRELLWRASALSAIKMELGL